MEIKKIVESLNQISEGFANLASAVEAMDIVSVDVSAENVEPKTVEELKEMGFTEFKVYAASIGVKCTGTRDEIMKRVLDKLGEIEDDESEVEEEDTPVEEETEEVEEVEEEPEEEEKPKKKVGKSKKSAPAKEGDEYDKLAEEYAEDMDGDDIIEALKEVGVKANSKNYITKLAEALREGLLEDDNEEEDEDSEVEADEVEVEIPEDNDDEEDVELDEDSYFEDYDVFSLNDFENMSEERKSAIKEKIVSIIDKEPKEKDIQKRLKDILTREEWTDVEEADTEYNELIKMLVEREKYLIDDDGDEITKGEAYEITNNEGEVVDMCCGHPLTYVEKTKSYICEKCGANFKAE